MEDVKKRIYVLFPFTMVDIKDDPQMRCAFLKVTWHARGRLLRFKAVADYMYIEEKAYIRHLLDVVSKRILDSYCEEVED